MASSLQNLSSPLAAKTARLGAWFVLPISIAIILGWQALQFIETARQQATATEQTPPSSPAAPANQAPGNHLLGLFGNASQEQPEQVASEALPESNLDLQISAIFLMSQADESSIIIEDGNRTLILKHGEEARPGIAIAKIESNRVTFKRNGKLEQLSFRGFDEGQNNNQENLPAAAPGPANATVPIAKAAGQNSPTAYQQFIQRKLAQNK